MSIVPLQLPAHAEARVLLHHLLEHGDIVGSDPAGRTVIQLAVDDWVLDKLMTLDAEAAELEGRATMSPRPMTRSMRLPVLVDLVRPKVIRGRRIMARSFGPVG